MRLDEIKKPEKGTYVGVRISEDSKNKLTRMAKRLNVPDILSKKYFHITVIYSRKYLPDFEPLGKYDESILATPTNFTVFPSQGGKRCLVLELDCPEIVKRHNEIMKEHKAEYDFDEYKCHITISYDIGDFETDSLSPEKALKNIEIIEEYEEDLNLDWLVNK